MCCQWKQRLSTEWPMGPELVELLVSGYSCVIATKEDEAGSVQLRKTLTEEIVL